MKHLLSVFLLFFFTSIFFKTQAQQKHFIYIESENQQPFAVVMNGKVYSSSDYGYVIVPKLSDGNYSFTVSFPLNKYPDQNFKCVINKKDLGYKLSNTAHGWVLQNTQTQKEVAANTTANNDFTSMLSDVVNDSNLTNKNIVFNNSKPDTVAASPTNADSNNVASAVTTVDTNAAASTVTTVDTNTAALSTITQGNNNVAADSVAQLQKISETKQDTGTNMVFVDRSSGIDTINVFVPSNDSENNNASTVAGNTDTSHQQSSVAEAQNIPAKETNSNTQTTDTTSTTFLNSPTGNIDTTSHAIENPFYKSNNQTTTDNNTSAVTPVTTSSPVATENSNQPKTTNAVNELCIKMISDNDLAKLKRKMFVQDNENEMVQTAVKYLSNKCITTDQVKDLGNIFSSDDGRYSLYDALYKNVYDYGNYANLENQIIDPYYKRRFEAMLK
jgi:hypothetical protein